MLYVTHYIRSLSRKRRQSSWTPRLCSWRRSSPWRRATRTSSSSSRSSTRSRQVGNEWFLQKTWPLSINKNEKQEEFWGCNGGKGEKNQWGKKKRGRKGIKKNETILIFVSLFGIGPDDRPKKERISKKIQGRGQISLGGHNIYLCHTEVSNRFSIFLLLSLLIPCWLDWRSGTLNWIFYAYSWITLEWQWTKSKDMYRSFVNLIVGAVNLAQVSRQVFSFCKLSILKSHWQSCVERFINLILYYIKIDWLIDWYWLEWLSYAHSDQTNMVWRCLPRQNSVVYL